MAKAFQPHKIRRVRKRFQRKTLGGLSELELRFVNEYLIDQNITGAAIRAGYSQRSASTLGHRALQKVEVVEAISRGFKQLLAQPLTEAQRVITETANVAFSDIGAMFTPEGKLLALNEMPAKARAAISSIEVTERTTGTGDQARTEVTRKVRLWDKNSSLDRLAKLHRMIVDQSQSLNMTLTGAVGSQKAPESMTDEEIEAEAVRLAQAILEGAEANRRKRLAAAKDVTEGAKVVDSKPIIDAESS